MAETGQDKTEEATPRRRAEARRDGNVAKSTDLTAAIMLLAAILGLQVLGGRLFGGMRHMMETVLGSGHAVNPARADDLMAMGLYLTRSMAAILVPFTLLILAAGLIACVGQVGFMVTGKPLVPSPKKLNPIKGVQQLFNARAAIRLVMSLGKVVLLTGIASVVIYLDLQKIMRTSELSVGGAYALSAQMIFELALILAATLIVLAILDFSFQKFQHSRDLRMTKQEVRDEMKRMDGDPMVKQRRQRVARQLALQRIGQAVPGADVIVTNPTHYAIALKYDSNSMTAPKVVAKGADYLALRIRQLGMTHGIPLVERKPLARALYANVEVGQEVPEEHYAAVAEVLAYVYRISGQKVA
jgi:flagellar biosynthetic protein FlhB